MRLGKDVKNEIHHKLTREINTQARTSLSEMDFFFWDDWNFVNGIGVTDSTETMLHPDALEACVRWAIGLPQYMTCTLWCTSAIACTLYSSTLCSRAPRYGDTNTRSDAAGLYCLSNVERRTCEREDAICASWPNMSGIFLC